MIPFKQFLLEYKTKFLDVVPIPFVEGMPSLEKVEQMKKWFQIHSDLYKNEFTIMYHATGESLPIESEGLKPTSHNRRRSYQSQSGYVYLAITPERAKRYGDWGNRGKSVVYEVKVLTRKLLPDLDSIRNYNSVHKDKINSTISNSIIYTGNARIKGSIPFYNIRKYSEE